MNISVPNLIPQWPRIESKDHSLLFDSQDSLLGKLMDSCEDSMLSLVLIHIQLSLISRLSDRLRGIAPIGQNLLLS